MIRWEKDPGDYSGHEWLGYLGKRIVCSIDITNTLFVPLTSECVTYSKLSHAKRGAETMIKRFLEDAGLEVRREFLDRLKKTIPFSCSSCSFSSCTVPCRAVRDAIDQEDETTEAAR